MIRKIKIRPKKKNNKIGAQSEGDRETERQRDRETEMQGDRDTERHKKNYSQKDIDRQKYITLLFCPKNGSRNLSYLCICINISVEFDTN